MIIRHYLRLTSGETETADFNDVITSQEGFCEESKRGDVIDINIKIIRSDDER